MKICMACRVALKVERNGVVVTYQGDTYSADLLKCPSCGHEILAGMSTARYDPDRESYDKHPEWAQLGEVDVN